MRSEKEQYYRRLLTSCGFREESIEDVPIGLGSAYSIPKEAGKGYFWIYVLENQYALKIHNFSFHEDAVINMEGPEGLSICYYYSISGEELDPYRKMHAGQVRFTNGKEFHFHALMHKNIPIQTVEIEIYPAYYEKFLTEKFGGVGVDFETVFRDIDWCSDFPKMEALLNQIWNYRGEGVAAQLFYDSLVSQAVSLIIDYNSDKKVPATESSVLPEEQQAIELVNKYLDSHFAGDVSIDQLCKICCFGRTKFKTLFKKVNHCTVTEYVTDKRLSHAEALLTSTNLTIDQVAAAVGYSNASRFAALFRKSTGLLPSDYRKSGQGR